MRGSLRRTLLWQVVGAFLYLLGLVVFLVVALDLFFPPSEATMNPTGADFAVLGLSFALIVTGRLVRWKFAGDVGMDGFATSIRRYRGPDKTKLEELGYHIPPESDGEAPNHADADAGATVTCPECGARNDREFSYCRACSGKLSE